jgi:hypothetical protein
MIPLNPSQNYFINTETVATLVTRNSNEAMVAPAVGSGGVCILRESGIRRSVLCWFFWQESGFGNGEYVFTLI